MTRCVPLLVVALLAMTANAQHIVWREGSPAVGPFGDGIAVIGDRDGDGHADVVRTVWIPIYPGALVHRAHAWCYSGRTGSLVSQGPLFFQEPTTAGDVDGDGVGDYWLATGGSILPMCAPGYCPGFDLRSGRDDSILQHMDLPDDDTLGHMMLGDLDLDGDRVPDVLIGTVFENGGILYAVSGDHVLYSLPAQPGEQYAPGLGKFIDFDHDGCDDFLLGMVGTAGGPNGSIDIRSGRDGSLLQRLAGPAAIFGYGQTAHMIGDLDGDAIPDVVAGDSGPFSPGVIAVLSSASGAVIHQWQVNQVGVVSGDDFGWPSVVCVDVDRDGLEDVVANSKSGNDGQFVFSGRDGALIQRYTEPNGIVRGNLEILPAQPGDPFPRWAANGTRLSAPYPTAPRTYMFSGAPDGVERTGIGSAGTLQSIPVLGLRSLEPSGFRVTLAGAEPGAFAILVVGCQQLAQPFFDLSLLGFSNSFLYPHPDAFGFFQAGINWPEAGYVEHEFQQDLVPAMASGAIPAYLQWIVFGNAASWPGGVSEAMRVWVR